ncbi:hypothetical protein EAH78_22210 [Pseudomonas arsenicoxydans]|uniref:Uncharacterized protein n=1 Tax=Pseudomonas arsenicoxydans TaxID=702115 RepID=A0A502HMG4_9PSED|nr:hypothetical protein EAH78_22210 [Pseudomonas arsenicoxydans]
MNQRIEEKSGQHVRRDQKAPNGHSVNIDARVTALFKFNVERNVGAGLLAKAVCQSTYLLNERPYSRASPLPH